MRRLTLQCPRIRATDQLPSDCQRAQPEPAAGVAPALTQLATPSPRTHGSRLRRCATTAWAPGGRRRRACIAAGGTPCSCGAPFTRAPGTLTQRGVPAPSSSVSSRSPRSSPHSSSSSSATCRARDALVSALGPWPAAVPRSGAGECCGLAGARQVTHTLTRAQLHGRTQVRFQVRHATALSLGRPRHVRPRHLIQRQSHSAAPSPILLR
jgi:hypothetical protein